MHDYILTGKEGRTVWQYYLKARYAMSFALAARADTLLRSDVAMFADLLRWQIATTATDELQNGVLTTAISGGYVMNGEGIASEGHEDDWYGRFLRLQWLEEPDDEMLTAFAAEAEETDEA